MNEKLTEDAIRAVYRGVLGREVESQGTVDHLLLITPDLESMIRRAIHSEEFQSKFAQRKIVKKVAGHANHNAYNFLAPRSLSRNINNIRKIILTGACLFDLWSDVARRNAIGIEIDRLHIAALPDAKPRLGIEQYDYQVAHIPLRSLFPDRFWFEMLSDGFTNPDRSQKLMQIAEDGIEIWLNRIGSISADLPIFILNYVSPSVNLNGRLIRTGDLRDPQILVRSLNERLDDAVRKRQNMYVVDIDNCASTFGRHHFSEDAVGHFVHNGLLNPDSSTADEGRIEPVLKLGEYYNIDPTTFIISSLLEADASYRSLRGLDAVKMVCVDLDDTLWRGVLAEKEYFDREEVTIGWPMGVIEALTVLKRRGVLISILSKNTEDVVEKLWSSVYGEIFPYKNFAIKKINWKPKPANMSEILSEANILEDSVVFLDDNPVERAGMALAFPNMRVVDEPVYYWKRLLLWSSETQSQAITNESSNRTEMVQAQIKRETSRSTMTHDDFIASLDVKISISTITSRNDPRFARMVELLNKTNQFNTTGRKFTAEEVEVYCRQGLAMVAEVEDNITKYGLVAIGLYREGVVEQVVMSCRVVGLGVELTLLSELTRRALASRQSVQGRQMETEKNLLSRDLFAKAGWRQVDAIWQTRAANPIPKQIRLEI